MTIGAKAVIGAGSELFGSHGLASRQKSMSARKPNSSDMSARLPAAI
ncbi:MAG TPA: hypothetical protein VNQ76_05145 [Planctomicrobium sp.]|nr:hypothetical protein [Planctomicrobium sp.]